MYTVTSVAALCGLLERAYHAGPGETGRTTLVAALKTTYEFGDHAAHLYAGTVLGSNSDNSAGIVRTNAERLIGTWRATGASSLADIGIRRQRTLLKGGRMEFRRRPDLHLPTGKADEPHVALWFHC